MKRRTLALIPQLSLILTIALNSTALAAQAHKKQSFTAAQVIAEVENRHGGKVISLVTSKDGQSYKIRLLKPNAKVIVMDIKTGADKVIKSSGKDLLSKNTSNQN